MEISHVNGVESSLNVAKQEKIEVNTANIEPKKDGNKKIALALAALATAAAAGVGVAVAAKKGKINLPKLKNSVQKAADDVGKVVKDTADDAVKVVKDTADDAVKVVKDTADDVVNSVKDVADDAAKAVKEGVEKKVLKQPVHFDYHHDEIKRLQNELKDCKDPARRLLLKSHIIEEQRARLFNMEINKGNTLSSKSKEFCSARASALMEQQNKLTSDYLERLLME